MNVIAIDKQTKKTKWLSYASHGDYVFLGNNAYEVQKRFEGGMASVFLLENKLRNSVSGLPSKIAIKKPNFNKSVLNNKKTEFEKEIKNWSSLNNSNIAACLGLAFCRNESDEPYPVAVMAAYQGTLRKFIKINSRLNKKVDSQFFGPIFLNLLDALDYAYQQAGLIHLDIKPNNILIKKIINNYPHTSPELYTLTKNIHFDFFVSDWGIAQAAAKVYNVHDITDEKELNNTLSEIGTPIYMAPERFKPGYKPIIESDVFSLGLVFWEIIFGTHLYEPFYFEHEFFQKGKKTPIDPIKKVKGGAYFEKIETEIQNKKHSSLQKHILKILKEMLYPDPSQRTNDYKAIKREIEQVIGLSRKYYFRFHQNKTSVKSDNWNKNILGISGKDIYTYFANIKNEELDKINNEITEILENPKLFFQSQTFCDDGIINTKSYIRLIIGLNHSVVQSQLKHDLISKIHYKRDDKTKNNNVTNPIYDNGCKISRLINEIGFGFFYAKDISQTFLIQFLKDLIWEDKIKETGLLKKQVSDEEIFENEDIGLEENEFSSFDEEISETLWQRCNVFFLQNLSWQKFGKVSVKSIEYQSPKNITGQIYYVWNEEPDEIIPLDEEEVSFSSIYGKKINKGIVSATQVLFFKGVPVEIFQINYKYDYELLEYEQYNSREKYKKHHLIGVKRSTNAKVSAIVPPKSKIRFRWSPDEEKHLLAYINTNFFTEAFGQNPMPKESEYQFGRQKNVEEFDLEEYERLTHGLAYRYKKLDEYLDLCFSKLKRKIS